jgi:hypothetical protein
VREGAEGTGSAESSSNSPSPDAHHAASEGVASASQPLPHLSTIQSSFGHHDVTSARAQVGGPAQEASARIGALAYTLGDRVGFRATPDLRLAAHEAAHVVQQRGGVQLEGGIGRAGDAYEQHADAVADAVAEGRSAAPLLDVLTGADSEDGPAVPDEGRQALADSEEPVPRTQLQRQQPPASAPTDGGAPAPPQPQGPTDAGAPTPPGGAAPQATTVDVGGYALSANRELVVTALESARS